MDGNVFVVAGVFMKQKGQSLVELALSITILMFLLSGAVEFGLIFFQFVQLRDAAQEGALYRSTNPNVTDADVAFRAKGASNSPIDMMNDPNLEVVVTYVDDNGLPKVCEGDGAKVTLNYSHKIFMPFLPQFIGGNVYVISASATDTILNQPC